MGQGQAVPSWQWRPQRTPRSLPTHRCPWFAAQLPPAAPALPVQGQLESPAAPASITTCHAQRRSVRRKRVPKHAFGSIRSHGRCQLQQAASSAGFTLLVKRHYRAKRNAFSHQHTHQKQLVQLLAACSAQPVQHPDQQPKLNKYSGIMPGLG